MKKFWNWLLGSEEEPETQVPVEDISEVKAPVHYAVIVQFKGDFCSYYCPERVEIATGILYWMGLRPHYCQLFQRYLRNNWSLPGEPRQIRRDACKRMQGFARPIELERIDVELGRLRSTLKTTEDELKQVRSDLEKKTNELIESNILAEGSRRRFR